MFVGRLVIPYPRNEPSGQLIAGGREQGGPERCIKNKNIWPLCFITLFGNADKGGPEIRLIAVGYFFIPFSGFFYGFGGPRLFYKKSQLFC